MRIGILEYQMTNSHLGKFYELLTGPVSGGDVQISVAYELSPTEQGAQWCATNNIQRLETAQQVVDQSDAILVLAPNNAELKLELARVALQSGKPTFLDKSLGDTIASAREVVRMASEHNTPIFSASSLRFSPELDEMQSKLDGDIESVFARGFGKWHGYSVHTIALALRFFGSNIKRLIDTGSGTTRIITLDDGKRQALIDVRESENAYEATPWQVGALAGNRYEIATAKDFDAFYLALMTNALEFFKTGVSPLSAEDMVASVAIEELADKSLNAGGQWVEYN